MQVAGHPVARTLEAGVTLFSAAEIRVVRAARPGRSGPLIPSAGASRAGAGTPTPSPAAAHRPPAYCRPPPQVLLPVGEAPEAVFQRYASLIVRHRQVELNNVRSFYKEAQKSPFKFFPWKQGNMHFRFLPVRCRRRVGCQRWICRSPGADSADLGPQHGRGDRGAQGQGTGSRGGWQKDLMVGERFTSGTPTPACPPLSHPPTPPSCACHPRAGGAGS